MVKFLRVVLPSMIGVLAVVLIFAPLLVRSEVSFVLAKDTVAIAKERMRLTAAVYRGEDGKGQPFTLRAGSAVQKTSKDPVVQISGLNGEILLSDGPAKITANAGRYDMDSERVYVDGPMRFQSAGGYAIEANNVSVDLKSRQLTSGGAVSGNMPLGSFSGGHLEANLDTRTVALEGRAHLHIVQGGGR
jgi:lipopolysaccharide export system protein LptC